LEAQPGAWHLSLWHWFEPHSEFVEQALPSPHVGPQSGGWQTPPEQRSEAQSVFAPQTIPSAHVGAQAGVLTHTIRIFETLAPEILPLPFVTLQLWVGPAGCLMIDTA
jgi:hypothetical protein